MWPEPSPPPPEALREHSRRPTRCCACSPTGSTPISSTPRPRLRAIANYAVGSDNIDVEAARARGIAVGVTPGVLTDATADIAFALLLAIARRLPEGEAAVRAGEWTTWEPDWLLGPRRPRRHAGHRRPRAHRRRGRAPGRGLRHERASTTAARPAYRWTSCSRTPTSSRCTSR